jgi:peroxiredoxin Q/BCP
MQVELKENSLAPSFKLPSSREHDVSLEDFRGKNLVLYFYPKDSTPGCTIEANQFSNKVNEFESFNTVILGVSKDSIKSHKNFIEKQAIKFELLSDINGELCEKYGVWKEKSMYGKKYMGIERSTFLINGDGLIKKLWYKVSVSGHVDDVLQEAEKLFSSET